MAAFIKAVMHMNCGHWLWGGIRSTQAVRETGELLRKTHHVNPHTGKSNRTNKIIIRISFRNKENN